VVLQTLDHEVKETMKKRTVVEENASLAREELSTSFKRFQHALAARERQLQGELDKIVHELSRSATVHYGNLETTKELLATTQSSAEKILGRGTEIEFLAVERQLEARLKEIQPAQWEAVQKMDTTLTFAPINDSQFDKALGSLGAIISTNTDATATSVDTKPFGLLAKGHPCSFVITAMATGGAAIRKGGDPFKVSVKGAGKVKAAVTDNANGTYTVTFTPPVEGGYQIKVQLRRKHVAKSPYSVTAAKAAQPAGGVTDALLHRSHTTGSNSSAGSSRQQPPTLVSLSNGSPKGPASTATPTSPSTPSKSPGGPPEPQLHRSHTTVAQAPKKTVGPQRNYAEVKKVAHLVGGKGSGSGLLNYPADVALTSRGELVVSDRYGHRVQIFSSEGAALLSIGHKGTEDGNFNEPWGVAVDPMDTIYVADRYNHRVQVFSRDGKFLRKMGGHGSSETNLSEPCGIAIDGVGNLLVAENGNHRVHIFDRKGAHVRFFGSKGSELGQFVNPFSVAVNSRDEILVSDMGNHRVQVFSSLKSGCTPTASFGSKGTAFGSFFFPSFVTTDAHDQILVADCNNKRVQIFSPAGQYVAKLPVADPSGIAVAQNGTVWICDFSTNYVKGL